MLIAACAVLGLLVGSFLNVVVARVPAGESIASPPSRCPSCQTPIAPRDNIPVLSWLLLRGRARCCGTPISRRYPTVEAGTALAFALVAAWVQRRSTTADPALWPLGDARLPDPAAVVALVAFLVVAAVGIALTLIDLDTFLLPYVIVFPSSIVVAVLLGGSALLAGQPSVALRMVLGGAALWLFYRLLHQVYAKGMGYGDVRLAAMVGGYLAWLGWDVLIVGAFLAFLVGGVFGVVMMAVQGAGLKTKIPYGPYMIAGSVLGLLFGHPIAQAYLRASGLA